MLIVVRVVAERIHLHIPKVLCYLEKVEGTIGDGRFGNVGPTLAELMQIEHQIDCCG
jgi:hypothetical protein